MSSSSKFPGVMAMITNFFFLFLPLQNFFLHIWHTFCFLISLFVNGFISFSSKLIISVPSSLNLCKTFPYNLFLYKNSVCFLYAYPQGLCFTFFLCVRIFKIILTRLHFFLIDILNPHKKIRH